MTVSIKKQACRMSNRISNMKPSILLFASFATIILAMSPEEAVDQALREVEEGQRERAIRGVKSRRRVKKVTPL